VIGQPSQTASGVNLIHTWDETGIVAYVPAGSEQVKELTLIFSNEENWRFWPKKFFSGVVVIGPHTLTRIWGVRELKAAGFKADSLFPHFWDSTVGEVNVSVHLDAKTQTKPVSIHLDFGRVKK
jgi:hypothetical protein